MVEANRTRKNGAADPAHGRSGFEPVTGACPAFGQNGVGGSAFHRLPAIEPKAGASSSQRPLSGPLRRARAAIASCRMSERLWYVSDNTAREQSWPSEGRALETGSGIFRRSPLSSLPGLDFRIIATPRSPERPPRARRSFLPWQVRRIVVSGLGAIPIRRRADTSKVSYWSIRN